MFRTSGLLLLLSFSASLAFGNIAYYGDFKVVGTGADAGISFEFLAPSPMTSSFVAVSTFVSCTVPSGETCSQVNYTAASGFLRLVTTGANGQNRTWTFGNMIRKGVYISSSSTGVEPGYVIHSGLDATAGQPQSNNTGAAFQFPIEVTATTTTPTYQDGATVTFTAPGTGPTASIGSSPTTDITGRTRVTPTASSTAGAYQITATATIGGNLFQTSFIAANVNTALNFGLPCQVTSANDDFTSGSLRYQVAACGKGGTITFASGINTVNLNGGQDIPLTQNLTIEGGGHVTLDGNSLSRIFFITGGTITLSNLMLQNGIAAGGGGGDGIAPGGGAAGMGGAIFVNAGNLIVNNVTFNNNAAAGGAGGSSVGGVIEAGGGGGTGGAGGSATNLNGNGGGGGDFGSRGGAVTGPASGDGAGGGGSGSGAFAGGGAGAGGHGGFGAGSGNFGGPGGMFGGQGSSSGPGGGGGAGLGGAIFMRNGTLSLSNVIFILDSATGGAGGQGTDSFSNGQGKGGALYISSDATASTSNTPTFISNAASDAGVNTACNLATGEKAADTNDVCGILLGPPTQFVVSAPGTATAGSSFSFTVTAEDASGNTIGAYTGPVHFQSSDGSAVLPPDSFLTSGVGTFSATLQTAGSQTITAVDPINNSLGGVSNTITVSALKATHFGVSAPTPVTAGMSFNFTVTALDPYNNTDNTYSGTAHFTTTDTGTGVAVPADSTLKGGTGTVSATLVTAGAQTLTATDVSKSSITGTSNTITVNPATATHFVVSAPPTATAGTAFNFTVTALDQFNNTDTNYAGNAHFTTTDSGTGVSLPANSTLSNGTKTSSATLVTAGNQAITATDTNNGSITGASPNIPVHAAAATHYGISAPPTAHAGTAFNFTVTALDQFNNTDTNYAGSAHFTTSDNGVGVSLPANSTLSSGTKTFSATLVTAGIQTISGIDSSNSSITGTSNNISVLVPPAIAKSFNPTTVEVGGNSSLTITVTNPNATALSSVQFSDTMPAGVTLISEPTGTCGTGATEGGVATVNTVAGTFSSDSNSLAAGQSCNVVLLVKGATPGTKNNTTSNVTANESGAGLTASATLQVNADAPPTISKSFTPATINVSSTSQLSFTLGNPNNTISLTGVAFTDTLPAGLVVATPNGLTGSCGGGTITATAGSSSVSLSGATLAETNSCTFSVNILANSIGVKNNTTAAVTSNEGGTGLSASATLTVNSNTPTHFSVSAPASSPAGTGFNFTVTALDQFGNTATGYSGTVKFTTTDSSSILPSPITLINGTRTLSATLYTSPTETITATDTASASITGTSNSITIVPGTVTQLGISAPFAATAGTAFNFTVAAQDQYGNTNPGYSGTVHFTSTDGQAVLPGDSKLTSGAGTFSATLKTSGNRTIGGTDTLTATIAGISANIKVSAATATHFTVSAPATATAGTAFNFTVTALDQLNNTVTGYTGTVHFTSTDGAAALPANSTLTSGVGTFSATLKTAGAQTVTATDTANSAATGTSNSILVAAGAVSRFSVSAPASATAGASLSFTVTAQDSSGNTVPGYTGTVRFGSTDVQASLPANSTLTSGTGSFTATLRTSGSQTITATDTANGAITGTSAPIGVGFASTIHLTVSAPATATAGNSFNFTVTAADSFNNTVTSFSDVVSFTSSDSKAVLPGNATLTNGIGTFQATLKTSGSRTITATDSTTPGITSSAAVAVSPGAPAGISIVTGNSQSATVDTRFGLPLTILVVDAYGNPIPGVTVTFNAPGSGASVVFFQGSSGTSANVPSASMAARPRRDLHPEVVSGITATAVTNSQGLASISVQANAQAGTYTVEADGAGSSVLFTLTNTFPDRPALTPQLDPSFLILHYTQAAPGSTPTPAASAAVNVNTQLPSTYTATVSVPWVTVTPSTNATNRQATVSATGANLAPGIYSTNVIFTFADNSVVLLPLQLYVIGPPSFKPDSTALTFIIAAGSTTPQTQSFIMRSSGADFSGTLTVQDVSGNGGAWLTVTPSTFSTPKQIQVMVDPTGLAAGTYQKNLVFAGPVGNSPFTVPITLTVVDTSQAIQ